MSKPTGSNNNDKCNENAADIRVTGEQHTRFVYTLPGDSRNRQQSE